MLLFRYLLIFIFVSLLSNAYAQQDVEFHLNSHLLQGKNILKVKRDFNDPYLWVLAQNNEVYRINSLDNTIDNFTSQFSSYSSLQFVDIAGRSKDTVFIATPTKLLAFQGLNIKEIGAAHGLNGTINAIGMDYTYNGGVAIDNSIVSSTLIISTNNGVYRYLVRKEVFDQGTVPSNAFLTEASYRNKSIVILTDVDRYADTVDYYSMVTFTPYTAYEGYLWMGGQLFGGNIRSAYSTTGTAYGRYGFTLYCNQFWATEKGLFQNSWQRSTYPATPYNRYLNNININKITSIYGLTGFGNISLGGYGRENILVATDQGLYFSNSKYLHLDVGPLSSYTFYHYDALGNIKVNDINVNSTSGVLSNSICEDGVWVAAANGLYLLKPDYAKSLENEKISSIRFQNESYSVTELQVCNNTVVNATIFSNPYSGISKQWYKNGVELPAESNNELKITASGDYHVVFYDPCSNVRAESNHLKVTVASAPTFTFNYPDNLTDCAGSIVELKANGSTSYQYRWYKNGVLNGNITNLQNVTQNGKYKVEVSSCSGAWVPSKEVNIDFIQIDQPVVTPGKITYCVGEQATLLTNITLNNAYTINWLRNGNIISGTENQTAITTNIAGTYTVTVTSVGASCSKTAANYPLSFISAPVFTFNYDDQIQSCGTGITELKVDANPSYVYRWYKDGALNGNTTNVQSVTQSGKYKIEVSACNGSWVSSKEVEVNFIQLPQPVISPNKTAFCTGDQATLTVNVPVNTAYTISWLRNGIPVAGSTNQTSLITDIAGNYTILVSSNSMACSKTSAGYSLTFNPFPALSILSSSNTTLCNGETVILTATYEAGNTITWSSGQTTPTIAVKAAGNYTATVKTPGGCETTKNVDVTFFPKPALNMPDATLCEFNREQITLTAPAGFIKYTWNGQPGTRNYTTGTLGKISLTVTDVNGCTATETITVASHCDDLIIPNTFTPNGDGRNDTWQISGLNNDASTTVKVFNRNGSIVFESRGYPAAWTGEYRGRPLPTGAYYYIITIKGNKQVLSGALNIIY